jgi:sigma-E factor negative regulatory protein RseB
MMRVRLLLLLVLAILALPAHAAERDAREWLERMSNALATGNYEGRFFHVRGSHSETMRIIHRVHRGKVTERLLSLDGSGREIIRNETEVICYLPDKRLVLVEKRTDDNALFAALPIYNTDLESHYRIEKKEVSKALGRKTQMILVQPRDQYRYGYRLWLDYETAMPLKSQLCDRHGNVIEQMLFAELNLRDRIPADQLKPSVSAEGFRWVRQDVQQPRIVGGSIAWNVIRVPAGFRLTASRMQIIAGSNGPVRHLVYSDGLASVSVFIEPRNTGAEPLHGLAKVGAAFVFSRDLDGHQVVAVGEVPAATVEAIAAGVTKDGAAGAPTSEPAPLPAPAPGR